MAAEAGLLAPTAAEAGLPNQAVAAEALAADGGGCRGGGGCWFLTQAADSVKAKAAAEVAEVCQVAETPRSTAAE